MEHELHRKLISLKVLQDTRSSVTKWVRKVLCPMDTFCLLQQFSESSARWHALWLSKVSMANALVFLRFWPWTFWQNSFYGLVFQWSTLCYILYQTFSYQGGYRCEIKMWTMSSNVRGCLSPFHGLLEHFSQANASQMIWDRGCVLFVCLIHLTSNFYKMQ